MENCKKSVIENRSGLEDAPLKYKTKVIYNIAFRYFSNMMQYFPDSYKTHEMCNKAFEEHPSAVQNTPDWFDRRLWYQWWLLGCSKSCNRRRKQRKEIKDELLLVACHLSRYWYWCIIEDLFSCSPKWVSVTSWGFLL